MIVQIIWNYELEVEVDIICFQLENDDEIELLDEIEVTVLDVLLVLIEVDEVEQVLTELIVDETEDNE